MHKNLKTVDRIIESHLVTVEAIRSTLMPGIAAAAKSAIDTIKAGGKMLIFGNGGSATDAQHIAAEFVVRFNNNRKALPAIALTTDSSILTAA